MLENLKPNLLKLIKDTHWYVAIIVAICFWYAFAFLQGVELKSHTISLSTLLYSVLLYPVLEEVVFRGLIQHQLYHRKSVFRKQQLGVSLANLATSVLFSAFHLINQDPTWAIAVFIPSLIFGYFRDRYDSIFPSVVLHIFYNLGFFTLF